MKIINKTYICLLTGALCIAVGWNGLQAQTIKRTADLYYTYMGPLLDGGLNSITYNDWMNNTEDTEKISGKYFSGGVMFNIFIQNLAGDFRMLYQYNMNENETVQHLYFSIAGRYVYRLTPKLSISSGPGIYYDSPPGTKGYDGSPGFQLPLGIVYNVGFDTRLIFDIAGRYGAFGFGEESTKLSYGMSAGIIFKVGRI